MTLRKQQIVLVVLILALLQTFAATNAHAQQQNSAQAQQQARMLKKDGTEAYLCGAPTKAGGKCKRHVKTKGELCFMHRGQVMESASVRVGAFYQTRGENRSILRGNPKRRTIMSEQLPTQGLVANLSAVKKLIEEAAAPRKWVSEAGPRQTKQVNAAMSKLSQQHNTMKELSGVIGGEERSFCFFSPFGGGSREDVSKVQRDIAEQFDYTVTAKNFKVIIAAIEAALPVLHANMPVRDKRITADQDAQHEQEAEQRKAERWAKKQGHSLQINGIVTELRRKYPWAKSGEGMSGQARAAVNLRQELALTFPGVRFSVKSDSFSGGNSVDYRWELGPTSKDVEAIARKYAYGTFDSMTDCAGEDSSAYGEAVEKVLGRARFCQGSRDIPEAIRERIGRLLCEAQQVDYTECEAGRVRLHGAGDSRWLSDHVRLLLSRTTFPQSCEITGIAHSNGGYDENIGEERESGYYLTFSEPTAAPASVVPTVGASGAVVSENIEKQGIEIRFPSKPSSDVLSTLKANGWRWSRFSTCWYHKASDRARRFANELAGAEHIQDVLSELKTAL